MQKCCASCSNAFASDDFITARHEEDVAGRLVLLDEGCSRLCCKVLGTLPRQQDETSLVSSHNLVYNYRYP